MPIGDPAFFVLRTPLLPARELANWAEGARLGPETTKLLGDADFDSLWDRNIAILRDRLRTLVESPHIRQSLFLASPSLETGIEHWKADPDSKKGLQAERAIVRYFARMCGRATPFGIFSGSSVGSTKANSRSAGIELCSSTEYRTATRLDYEFLFGLTTEIVKNPEISLRLKYTANSSLYRLNGHWHYFETRQANNGETRQGNGDSGRTNHLVRLESDEYLEALLAQASEGHITGLDLIDILAVRFSAESIDKQDIEEFVREAINCQILVPAIVPNVTGPSALDTIIDQLDLIPEASGIARVLTGVRSAIAELDTRPVGTVVSNYKRIADDLRSLKAPLSMDRLFQVDMLKPVISSSLPPLMIESATQALEALCRISRPMDLTPIAKFRDEFTARYERAWVPLREALDDETGIGFGSSGTDASPLLRGLPVAPRRMREGPRLDRIDGFLAGRVEHSLQSGALQVDIKPEELPNADGVMDRLPGAFSILISVMAESQSQVADGNYKILLRSGVGPSGARLLGRFCMADSELERAVRQHLREEEAQDPDSIFAEIVHLPEGRLGNVMCRPVLRDYEICYLGRSGAPIEYQIPFDDLLVTVDSDQVLLYSRRLRKRVIPRLTNSHSYHQPRHAACYRFLGYLQQQWDAPLMFFDWGAMQQFTFLPRITVGKAILSLARWRINEREVDELSRETRSAGFRAFQQIRESKRLPRWLSLVEDDNALPVDLDNPLSVDACLQVLKRHRSGVLQELFPPELQEFVRGPEGGFYHEIILPFVHQPSVASKQTRAAAEKIRSGPITPYSKTERVFVPGESWLYFKVFSGPSVLDTVLTRSIPPLLNQLRADGHILKWFFIRYPDPQHHLRFRFQVRSRHSAHETFDACMDRFGELLRAGDVHSIQLDTYTREIERYGGHNGMLVAEEVFCNDSDAVLRILASLDGDRGLELRWKIALMGIDGILSDFGMDLDEKLSIVRELRDAFQTEHGMTPELKGKVGDRFREERNNLRFILSGDRVQDAQITNAQEAFADRSKASATAFSSLRTLLDRGELRSTARELSSHYVHMHVNRLLRSNWRPHEAVLYDFLHRLYNSRREVQQSGRGNGLNAMVSSDQQTSVVGN